MLDDGRTGAVLGEVRLTGGPGLRQEPRLNVGTRVTEVRGSRET